MGSASGEVLAQPSYGQRVKDRYNRVSKGSNVAEWQKRLSSDDPAVRLDAVESLGKEGGEEAVKPLLDATADEDRRVRIKAIDYLGNIGSPAAAPLLLQQLFIADVDLQTKKRILVALGRIRDPSSAVPLLNFARHTDDEATLCSCIFALGEIGSPAVSDGLRSFAKNSDDATIKRLIADALSKIETRVAVAPNQQPTLLELEKRLAPRR